METLIEKYKEFYDYVSNFDMEEVKDKYSRQEIDNFIKDIDGINKRYITSELRKISKEKKEEEYPELLGVHNFPILREIDFLGERKKLELDKYLVMFRLGTYLSEQGLYRIVGGDVERLVNWLIEKEIVEKEYILNCINCREDSLGKLTEEERKIFEYNYKQYQETNMYEYYEVMEELVQGYCVECDYSLDQMLDCNYDLYFQHIYKVIKRRDTSLDNV